MKISMLELDRYFAQWEANVSYVLCASDIEGYRLEAIFVCLNVLLGPRDHAIVVWPAFQSLYSVAHASGAEVTLLPLDASIN